MPPTKKDRIFFMNAEQIRQEFLDFFRNKGHKTVRSSSLVPANDPTLLFTNAGMNQFKDYFLGTPPNYTRAVTCQKVMRAGGKHNDLENVGVTARHHTFFEMLGNFSFGDYFKEDAIKFAWEFLTERLGIPAEKLAVSIFQDDDQAMEIWTKQIGVSPDRVAKLGEKDNFWAMGDTGPCGPCSEIHYDLYGNNGKTPAESLEHDDGRFLEIWNLVFMQFEKNENGEMIPLPKPSIDTGMGLERIASVLAGVKSNYETSLFVPLLDYISEKAGYEFGTDPELDVSCRVIADHVRALTFLIADGVIPDNDGRGYVMRRILRRASRHSLNLNAKPGFLAEISGFVVTMMREAYPDLPDSENLIRKVIQAEEERFSGTLRFGMKHLDKLISEASKPELPGEKIFKLYDTYGFPRDLVDDVLSKKNFSYNHAAYDKAMEVQKNAARSAQEGTRSNSKINPAYLNLNERLGNLSFSGYETLSTETSVLAMVQSGHVVESVNAGEEFEIVLEDTPFYAEGGGQTGDTGLILTDDLRLRVTDTFKPFPGFHVSKVKLENYPDKKIGLSEFKKVRAEVNSERRKIIESHHTSTHILNYCLRFILGEHVKQSGSLVDENRLRFDFVHFEQVSPALLQEIEDMANQLIRENHRISTSEETLESALASGALAFFGDKYGKKVRVVKAGPSVELCGGCHTSATGNLSFIKIISEQSVAAGIRRIEAVSGIRANERINEFARVTSELTSVYKTSTGDLPKYFNQQAEAIKDLEKTVNRLKCEKMELFISSGKTGNGKIDYFAHRIEDPNDLNIFAPLLQRTNGLVSVLYVEKPGAVNALVSVSPDLKNEISAKSICADLALAIDGKGGGKDDIARCGGTSNEGLKRFLGELEAKLK